MVHIERYLRDSIENEKNLTWNRRILELIQEMIHENNLAMADEKIAEFEARYDTIVQTAAKEYFCECLIVLDHYAAGDTDNLYQ